MDKVVFQSTYKGLSLRFGKEKIEFYNHLYSTTSPKEIEFLRKQKNVWEVQGDPVVLSDVADPELKTTIPEPSYSIRAKKAARAAKTEGEPEPPKKGGRGRK